MNAKRYVFAVLLLVLGIGIGWWFWMRLEERKAAPGPPHFVMLLDASDSTAKACESNVSILRGLTVRSARRGSTVTLLRTGDTSTRNEPQVVFAEPVPPSAESMPFTGRKKAADAAAGFTKRALAACEQIPVKEQSPVARGVLRGIDHLRSLGCDKGAGCVLVARTDLQDNADLAVLRQGGNVEFAPIDNHDIQVVMCGYAEGIPDAGSIGTDALLKAWKGLFTAPAKFAPYCGESIFAERPSANDRRRYMKLSIESLLKGKERPDIRAPAGVDLSAPLLMFSPTDSYTLGDSFEGTLICGSPGSGKTSGSGKNLAYALLRTPMMGGLILTVKPQETQNWIAYARACGREADLIVFNAESGHVFDPLWYEWHRPGRGAGDLESIIDLFSTLLAVGKPHAGTSSDRFWELAAEQLMRNTLVLLSLSGEPISIANMHRLIQSLPSRPGEFEEAAWQSDSYCANVIRAIRERKETLTTEQWQDLDMATHYAFKRWPGLDERPRSSIEITWASMADKFLFSPFSRIFCSGRATFVPELTTHQGKLIVVDFPTIEYGHETGKLINILTKLIFQRAWLRRDLTQSSNPCFLWQDEFQTLITRRCNAFQQTCREVRLSVVCLTQNILNLSEELGEQQPGSKTKAFLGNLMLKIFHQQNDPETNTYAAELIGKQYRYLDSYNMDAKGAANVGAAQQLVYNVEPIAFSQLMKPDGSSPISTAIVYQGGKAFNATITGGNPAGSNFLTVAFSRNV